MVTDSLSLVDEMNDDTPRLKGAWTHPELTI